MPANPLVTEEEMSALLEAGPETTASPGAERRRRVVPYNFRRPDRVSKEQVRSLYLLHDMFSHSLSSSMPIFLRAISEVTLISVDQLAYVEYLHGLPDPTAIFTLSLNPLQGVAALEVNPSIAFPVIDRMLGGLGVPIDEPRAVTEIEQKILEGFLKLVTDDLREAWMPLIELDLKIVGRETRPQLLQIVAPNEVVLSITFQIQVADTRGTMSLCIPTIALEPIIQHFNQSVYSRSREVPPEQTRALFDTLSIVSFPVAAELRGTKASMNDLMHLVPGDVLQLDNRVGQSVAVSVGGVVKFYGDLGAHERHTAVHLHSTAKDE